MKNYTVTYYHGQFIDEATGKRIIPKQGAHFGIQSDNDAFLEVDEKLLANATQSPQQKAEAVEKKHGKGNYYFLLAAGTRLHFRVGNSKKVQGDENQQYIFECVLLEDQYLYKLKDRKGDKADDWRLYDCQCKLVKCIEGGLMLTEQIPSESLNRLFTYTVMFYFSMQRSGSCNVFHTFFVSDSERLPSYHSTTWGQNRPNCLKKIREKAIKPI